MGVSCASCVGHGSQPEMKNDRQIQPVDLYHHTRNAEANSFSLFEDVMCTEGSCGPSMSSFEDSSKYSGNIQASGCMGMVDVNGDGLSCAELQSLVFLSQQTAGGQKGADPNHPTMPSIIFDRGASREQRTQVVSQWLEAFGLDMYAPVLQDLGYDELSVFQALQPDELREMLDKVDVKAGHRVKFRRAVEELQHVPEDSFRGQNSHLLYEGPQNSPLPDPCSSPRQVHLTDLNPGSSSPRPGPISSPRDMTFVV